MEAKVFKPLLIVTIVFASISFGALVGALSTLQTYPENITIYLIVAGVAGFIAIILTIILVVTLFKNNKK